VRVFDYYCDSNQKQKRKNTMKNITKVKKLFIHTSSSRQDKEQIKTTKLIEQFASVIKEAFNKPHIIQLASGCYKRL
jgi:hypothetical protein